MAPTFADSHGAESARAGLKKRLFGILPKRPIDHKDTDDLPCPEGRANQTSYGLVSSAFGVYPLETPDPPQRAVELGGYCIETDNIAVC